MTNKERAYLRGMANKIDPCLTIGKDGVSENTLDAIELLFDARELIKIKVLQNCACDAREVADEIQGALDCEIVQVIGSKIVLFNFSKRKDFTHLI